MPNFSAMWVGFVNSLRAAGLGFMNLISARTPIEILLAIVGGIIALWILKTILSPGGARRRMKGMAAVWIMIPLVIGVGGVIAYFVIEILAGAPRVST
jgi:hypothetical protein